MKALQFRQWRAWLFPIILLICPMFFLILWIPPFGIWLPIEIYNFFHPSKPAILFCYSILICAVALNWINAFHLSRNQNVKGIRTSLLIIRIASIFVYPSLAWGQLLALLYLMGPVHNQHIFYLIALSFVALNISGMFYAIRLILYLKKIRKIKWFTASCYIIFGFIIVFDIISALILQIKCRKLM